MPLILVASTNPVKLAAVRQAFLRMFPDLELDVAAVDVPSGVSDQPASDEETYQGAFNRARAAQASRPEAAYAVGIEGGVEAAQPDGLQAFAWVVVLDGTRVGKARSGSFELPPRIVELVRQGIELGEADDLVFNRLDSKRKDGAIGILTGGIVDREALYTHAVLLALVPFRQPGLYPPVDGQAHKGSSAGDTI